MNMMNVHHRLHKVWSFHALEHLLQHLKMTKAISEKHKQTAEGANPSLLCTEL